MALCRWALCAKSSASAVLLVPFYQPTVHSPYLLGAPQAFSSWVHLIAIRMLVESILRYGLPPAYQAAALVPVEKSEPKLRAALNAAFSGGERSA